MTTAAALFMLGLFPALFLPVLQLMVLMVLIELIWRRREITRISWRSLLRWPNIVFGQFAIFFLINALAFETLEGTPSHFRVVALEALSTTLLSLVMFMLWLQLRDTNQVKSAILNWLPLGLGLTFCVATLIFATSPPGTRIEIFTPNALVPPLWFLILTLLSFCWWPEMSGQQKLMRVALFLMAGLMTLYGAARLVMLGWLLSSLLLAAYFIIIAPDRRWVYIKAALVVLPSVVAVIFIADQSVGGLMLQRFELFLAQDVEALRAAHPRLMIWPASVQVILDNPFLGVGQVNERLVLQQEIGWDLWLRAHQTYLSYLIAGGVPALVSGLLIQLPVLKFLRRDLVAMMFPAFVGLGVVLTLNCLTDSIFQSFVSVQVYMIVSLILLRAVEEG